jgi:AcrR family transcriptional regulator
MARPKSDIEPRILSAARVRFLSDGVDGASLRAIAADAGTSIGMVYYYFPTKDELFFGVVEELYQRLLKDIEAAIAPDVSVHDRVERVFLRIARLTEEELLVLRLVVREALTSSERFARLRARFQSGHVPMIARLISDGYANGVFDPKLHPMIAMLSVAGVGVMPQLLRRALDAILPFPGTPSGEELAKALVGVLFNGTGAPDKK